VWRINPELSAQQRLSSAPDEAPPDSSVRPQVPCDSVAPPRLQLMLLARQQSHGAST
jgi:hypothetical protein